MSNLTQAEIKRREKEFTTYCNLCDLMIYAVPAQSAANYLYFGLSRGVGSIKKQIPVMFFKKKKERLQSQIDDLTQSYDEYINYLTSNNFYFVCSKCYNGILLNQKPPSKMRKKKGNILIKCNKCGKEMMIEDNFCKICGHTSEFMKVSEEATRTRHIPKEIVGGVWLKDGGKCAYCGNTQDLQLDHIIPFSKGGANSVENLQLLCRACNLKKSNNI